MRWTGGLLVFVGSEFVGLTFDGRAVSNIEYVLLTVSHVPVSITFSCVTAALSGGTGPSSAMMAQASSTHNLMFRILLCVACFLI